VKPRVRKRRRDGIPRSSRDSSYRYDKPKNINSNTSQKSYRIEILMPIKDNESSSEKSRNIAIHYSTKGSRNN
jgi:hypothetical protein